MGRETLEGGPVTPDAMFATVFAPGEGLNGLIFEINEGPISVTESNLDAVLQDIAAAWTSPRGTNSDVGSRTAGPEL